MVDIIKGRNVRFVVCGLGRIGLRHATLIQENPEATLVATIDPQSTNAIEGVPHFGSIEDFNAANISADVACIATPNGLHAKQAIAFIHEGLNVVIEKPIALTRQEAEDVVHASLERQKLVFGVMQNRYSPPSKWLKELIDSKKLGDIYLVSLQCYWNRDEKYYKKDGWHGTAEMDGGTLFTQFSHFIDLLYWLFGDIDNISGRFENFNHTDLIDFEDSGLVHFDFKRGGKGSLIYSTSTWDSNLESSITILGEKGSVKVSGQYMDKVEYCHVEGYTMPELEPSNPPNDYGAYKGSAANHSYVFDNVISTLRGKGAITTNALEGLKVVEIIERIYRNR